MNDCITIVIPWYGPDTAGGAETQARQLAIALHAQGALVHIWTTVGRDSFAPADYAHYPHGLSELDGIPVRRFAISPPYSHTIPAMLATRHYAVPQPWQLLPEHELRLLSSLVSSEELLHAIVSEGAGRRFIFMPYPFPTTFWGLILAGEQGYLLPCLHDEPYAYYRSYRWMFGQAQRILANSPTEGAFARQLYTLAPERVVICGEGIDLTQHGDRERFRAQYALQGPVLYFAGARPQKNTDLLMRYVREYWARRGGKLTLMLSGRELPNVPAALQELILPLGFLSPQERTDAYAAADIFINPSTIESFSIVLMEAWLQGTAALVNGACAVTREAAEISGGGLAFASFAEFASALDLLLADAELRRALGARGQAWVLANCRWEDVARRTIAALGITTNALASLAAPAQAR
jgi:glycosyltransferase involved in cell wall biosynthesis